MTVGLPLKPRFPVFLSSLPLDLSIKASWNTTFCGCVLWPEPNPFADHCWTLFSHSRPSWWINPPWPLLQLSPRATTSFSPPWSPSSLSSTSSSLLRCGVQRRAPRHPNRSEQPSSSPRPPTHNHLRTQHHQYVWRTSTTHPTEREAIQVQRPSSIRCHRSQDPHRQHMAARPHHHLLPTRHHPTTQKVRTSSITTPSCPAVSSCSRALRRLHRPPRNRVSSV